MCFNVVIRHETAGNYRLSTQIYSIYAIQTSTLPLKIVNSRFFCQKNPDASEGAPGKSLWIK